MLDNLMKMADGPLKDLLAQNGGFGEAAPALKESFLEVIQTQTKSGNFDSVLEMFSGKDTPSDSPVVNSISGDLTQGLTQKLGIDGDKAMAMASAAIPLLMNLFNKQINDSPMANEDIQKSALDSFKGNDSGGLESIMGSLLGGGKNSGGLDLGGLMDLGKGLFK